MAKITFLGNNANLTKNQHPVSFVVEDKTTLLVDTGPTVVQQLYLSGYSVSDIDAVVVTHCHGDHTLGFPYLAFSRFFEGLAGKTGPSAVPLVALQSVVDGLLGMLAFCYPPGKFPGFDFVPYIASPTEKSTFSFDDMALQTVPVSHAVPNIGMRIKLSNGAALAYSSDTVLDERIVDLAKGCDLLIHEAFGTSMIADLGARTKHGLAGEAGQVAKRAGVKRLALVHLMPRFVGNERLLVEEASQFFDGEVFVPDALSSINL